MRTSSFKSEAMVFSRKKVECPLQLRDELLPQLEEFKSPGLVHK